MREVVIFEVLILGELVVRGNFCIKVKRFRGGDRFYRKFGFLSGGWECYRVLYVCLEDT